MAPLKKCAKAKAQILAHSTQSQSLSMLLHKHSPQDHLKNMKSNFVLTLGIIITDN